MATTTRWPHILLLIAVRLAATCASAQIHKEVPREDGHSTPLMIYAAAGHPTGCPPLAVISHGAGGSEYGIRYLADALAAVGYTAVVAGHRESGLAPLQDEIRAHGMAEGIQAVVSDPAAEGDRLLDIGSALRWAEEVCHRPFRVLLGHSMGAETVMLEAGTPNLIHLASPPAAQNRFNAYVALSPEGPGIVFPDHAWSRLSAPMLILTGTFDQSLHGGVKARLVPWSEMPRAPHSCHWQGFIEGTSHFNFGGDGMGAARVKPIVTATVLSFLAGVRAHNCTAPASIVGLTVRRK